MPTNSFMSFPRVTDNDSFMKLGFAINERRSANLVHYSVVSTKNMTAIERGDMQSAPFMRERSLKLCVCVTRKVLLSFLFRLLGHRLLRHTLPRIFHRPQ